ncbi:MAG: carboxypeptidase-like regulatory domain-containing protein, partial [Pirellulaceae bacterium]
MLFSPGVASGATGPEDTPRRGRGVHAKGISPGAHQAVRDVSLDRTGTLHGVVLDAEGLPAGHVEVKALRQGRFVTRSVTDASGRFRIVGLRGGLWRLEGGNAYGLFRVWAVGTAPPAARDKAVLLPRRPIVRGQNSRGYRL